MQLSLLDVSRAVEERIARFAERAPRLLVAWSGGKDSTAALLAALRAAPGKTYAAYVHVVGQTHAANTQAVLAVAKKLGMRITYVDVCGRRFKQPLRLPRPPALIYIRSHGRSCRGFWHEAMQRGWPAPVERTKHHGKRWCCQVFKTESFEGIASVGFKWHIVGIKAADSRYRKQLLAGLDSALPVRDYGSHMTLYPLYDMSDNDVWTLIRHYDEEIYRILIQQYDVFGYSPNCVICPLQSRKNFQRTVEQMPTAWLERTRRMLLLLLQRHSCPARKWTCQDLAWKLETIEKELEKRR